MKPLSVPGKNNSPAIHFLPGSNTISISGRSAPEDVRVIYYPVIEWFDEFTSEVKKTRPFTMADPLILSINLEYFNSSSAKFIYDIITRMRDLKIADIPVIVEWHYDAEDTDMRGAGEDLSALSQMEFRYCPGGIGGVR